MSRRICSCGSLRIASRFPLPSCRFVTASICCRSLPHATPSSFLPFTTVFPMSSWKRVPSAFHWWRRTPAEWPMFLSRGSTPSSSKRETSTIAVAQSRMSRPAMAKPFGLLVQKLRRWCWSISRPSAKRSATSICSMESLHEEIDLHRPRADTRLLPRQAADAVVECRTADGKLLWKIKKSEDKVKISDNEENRNPYELKFKEDKIKVYAPVDRLLGEVKYYGDNQRVEVKDAEGHEVYRARAVKVEPSFGVALLDRIPARERAIIMAELAAPLH